MIDHSCIVITYISLHVLSGYNGVMNAPGLVLKNGAQNFLIAIQTDLILQGEGLYTPNVVKKGGEAAVKNSSKQLTVHSDIVLNGGRSGQFVKALEGPPNSVIKGGSGRIFITDDGGKVIWDITKDRAKSVIPGQGFGPKIAPTKEQLDLLRQVWGQ